MKHLAQHHTLLRHLWWWVTLFVLLMAVYVVAGRELMQLVPAWREPLVQLLREQSGLPLSISSLSGRMEGLTPVFDLQQVKVPAADGDPDHALTIKQVSISLDLLMSLLHRSVWLRDLRLSGLNINLEQQADGHFKLRGFPEHKLADPAQQDAAHSGKANLDRFLKLLYRQKQVILDHVDLALTLKNFPPITTHDARLEMTSSGEHHQLAMRLQTQERPLSLDVRLQLTKDAYQLSDLSGKAYVALSGQNIQYWLSRLWQGSIRPDYLSGRLAFWLSLDKGHLEHAALSLGIAELVLGNDAQVWEARQVKGLVGLRYQDGYQLQVQGLDFNTSGGHWHSGTMGAWWNGKQGADADWKLLLTSLNLRQLSNQLLRWPFPLPAGLVQVRDRLELLRPQANLDALFVAGHDKTIEHFGGRIRQASVEAVGKAPGVAGIAGWFAGSPSAGVAGINSSLINLNVPLLYDHELGFAANGSLRWFHGDDGLLRVETGAMQVSNQDGKAELVAGVTVVPGKPPLLHLLADVSGDHVERAYSYIPTRKLHKPLDDWLKQAITGGKLTLGRFLYEGPVHIDPNRQQDRTQEMQFDLADAGLHFLPGWPALTNLSGTVLLAERRVSGMNLKGSIYGSQFQKTAFEVWDDDPGGSPKLIVSSEVAGRADDVSLLLHNTPLSDHLPPELLNWQLDGGYLVGNLLLRLDLKHGSGVEPLVVVQARASQVDLSDKQRHLKFSGIGGNVHFDLQRGIQISDLVADWLGSSLQGRVSTSGGAVAVHASGELALAPLRQWLDASWLSSLSGSTPADIALSLPWRSKQPVVLQLNTDLKGVAIDLPAPLGKAADASLPSSLTLTNGTALTFRYGNSGKSAWQGSLKLAQGKLLSGVLHAGAGKPKSLPASGLIIEGHLPSLKVAPWVRWLGNKSGGAKEGSFPLQRITLKANRLDLFDFHVPNARLQITPASNKSWQMKLYSHRLSGSLLLPAGYVLRGSEPMTLKVTHLNWPALSAGEKKAASLSPMGMPNANVDLENLVVGGKDYGSWQGYLRPDPQGIEIQKLHGNWRHVIFDGALTWSQQAGKERSHQRSHYVGRASTTDLGAVQKDWGVTPLILSNKVSAQVDLSWKGTPLDFDYKQLQGKGQFVTGSCRLPQLEQNNPLLRALGVLNVGSIARRLRFDFSDLYKKGLSCDSINGDMLFDDAHLTVNKLHLKSPSADIRLTGKTNLVTETMNGEMQVELPISSNLYAGCLAGPAACAGIFVFNKLFGNKLEKAAALHYRISGTWTIPVVKEK